MSEMVNRKYYFVKANHSRLRLRTYVRHKKEKEKNHFI